jgi:dipeptidyl aminopeptidase/acylaminoacyl peptidase
VSTAGDRWVDDRCGLYSVAVSSSDDEVGAQQRRGDLPLARHVVLARDGTKIAYEAKGENSKPDIYVMNADGSARVQLTHHRARDENPDWSPDGKQIAFYSERPGNAEIYVMNTDGTHLSRVTHDPWYDQAVRWEPAQTVVQRFKDGF